ncbi:MAG: endo-1,4-beta-xylanase [Treponema sp.]|jgi:GH35 family endo-1,4-beta-xylanase|nr:endo-1,4-beta-xylanase [Treponema sp.]
MPARDYDHRKSAVKLRLNYGNGASVAREPVKISQIRHEFLFGCGGFDAVELAGGKADGAPLSPEEAAPVLNRLEKIFSVNNYATLPFYLGRYEPVEGKPDQERNMAAAKWFSERNVITKGHPLCWHSACAPWLMEYSNSEILKRVIARIERDVGNFKGLIDRWDVINEVVIMPVFDKYDNAITRICRETGRVKLVKEVFAAARRANPDSVLVLNDFNTSIDYEILIDGCLEAGASIDVIGIQSHQHQGYWGREKLQEVLDRFSRFGLPLHFTENTLISGDLMPGHIADLNDWQVAAWPSTPEGEERQARELSELYEILFSHPSVEALTTWCPIDGRWLKAPAGLLREDNSAKPSYHTLKKKILEEWRTEEQILTNDAGELSLEGFRGTYEVSARDTKALFVLDGKAGEIHLTLLKTGRDS